MERVTEERRDIMVSDCQILDPADRGRDRGDDC